MSRVTEIERFIEEVILEKTRYERETGEKFSQVEQLRSYVDDPWVFVQFTDVNKLGIKPPTTKGGVPYSGTPLGVYCYPISYLFEKYGIDQNGVVEFEVPYGRFRRYLVAFRVKESARDRVLNMTADTVPQEWIDNATDFLESMNLDVPAHARGNSPSAFYKLVRTIVFDMEDMDPEAHSKNSRPIRWREIFLKLGITGVVDHGTREIYDAEPTQAVFFNVRDLEPVMTVDKSPSEGHAVEMFNSKLESEISKKLRDAGFEVRMGRLLHDRYRGKFNVSQTIYFRGDGERCRIDIQYNDHGGWSVQFYVNNSWSGGVSEMESLPEALGVSGALSRIEKPSSPV